MINILVVEDDKFDFINVKKLLSRSASQEFQISHVATYQQAEEEVLKDCYDVYLVDQNLGCAKGLDLIHNAVRVLGYNSPFILLTGMAGTDIDKLAIKRGAADFIPKQELTCTLLERVILHSLDRKQIESKLLYIANHDELTGLANRTLFNQKLYNALCRNKRTGRKVALFFLDLDRFKLINDSLGHEMGDTLLTLVAQRLRIFLREEDVIARLGGDEFVVLSEGLNSIPLAQCIAEKIVQSFRSPFVIDDHEIHISTCVGIAIYPDCGSEPQTLIRKADLALYRAKESEAGSYRFYSDDLDAAVCQRLRLEKALHSALENQQELSIKFQPKIDIHNQEIMGVEALLRWHHPEMGNIPPNEFIPIAEETGLIIPLGAWVIREAIDKLQPILTQLPWLNIAINVSAKQLRSKDLLEAVQYAINRTVSPTNLEIELTEEAFIQNSQDNDVMFSRLLNLGVDLAIDDFGTGYSSLSYLKYLPVSVLKVDRCFIKNLNRDLKDYAIVKSIGELANALGIKVVAEGIEDEQQLNRLRTLNCDIAQGFYFSQPLTLTELQHYLRTDVVGCAPKHLA